jgi:hypothetical protein
MKELLGDEYVLEYQGNETANINIKGNKKKLGCFVIVQ